MPSKNNLDRFDVWVIVGEIAKEIKYERRKLAYSIIEVESGFDSFATRYEPQSKWFHKPSYWAKELGITVQTESMMQKVSFGLMQILGSTARSMLGFDGHLTELCIPSIGIYYGIKYLQHLDHRYKGHIPSIVSAYNAGSAIKKDNGDFINQEYVDKVMSLHNNLILFKPNRL